MNSNPDPGYWVMVALGLFIAASAWLGLMAQKKVEESSFLKGYFLGNRGLGAWTMALTATVQSGGTFMGFPSLVYNSGWIMTLWIASYMMVPLTGFGVIAKRLAHLSRRTGAITVPDMFRERFNHPGIGVIASLLIIFFMFVMLVAQFKAGAVVLKIAFPGTGFLSFAEDGAIDRAYLVGLAVFSITVVGYTLVGGFLASVWTDLFQSVMMFIGVVILLGLAIQAVGSMESATLVAVENTDATFAFGPGYLKPKPGEIARTFMPLGIAVSFYFNWVFAGLGSPSSLVRVMAAENTQVLRRSIVVLALYNLCIYLPLIMICIAGRALIPDLDKTDEIVPRLALTLTKTVPGGPFVAGLILAAPFGAVMATVSAYLLVIASGLVKDLYLRFVNPQASPERTRHVTYTAMILVGVAAVALNVRPVQYLQALVVMSGTTGAATFVVPTLMACYWRRATAIGTISSMLAGAGTMIFLYVAGWIDLFGPDEGISIPSTIAPAYLGWVDPLLWGLTASLITGVVASLLTPPPDAKHVSWLFDKQSA